MRVDLYYVACLFTGILIVLSMVIGTYAGGFDPFGEEHELTSFGACFYIGLYLLDCGVIFYYFDRKFKEQPNEDRRT
jgi:hypothetical protein